MMSDRSLSMKMLALLVSSLLAMTACASTGDTAEQPVMACDVGPLWKTYGTTEWLVYSCKDARSVVVVAAPGNPAMPFFFMLSSEDDGIRVYGEGEGDKSATKPAFDELKEVTASDLARLISETQQPSTAR